MEKLLSQMTDEELVAEYKRLYDIRATSGPDYLRRNKVVEELEDRNLCIASARRGFIIRV